MGDIDTTEAPEDLLDLSTPVLDGYRYACAVIDPHGRYLLVNHSFASLHGGTPEDLRGSAEADLIARAVATSLNENDRLALYSPSATVTEERVIDSVGRRRVVMCRCSLTDPVGAPHAVCRMYGSATARERVLAEFRRLLDLLDPTGSRARSFDVEYLGAADPVGGIPLAAAVPSAAPREDPALLAARAAAEEERASRHQAETQLAQARETQDRLDATVAALGRERAAAGERERQALARAAELESVVAADQAARAELERRAQKALDRLADLERAEPAQADAGDRRRAEAAVRAERARRAEHEEAERLAAALAASTEEQLSAERAARESLAAELDRTRHALEDERAARESLAAELDRIRHALEHERATREALAAEVVAAGAAASESRSQATTLEAQLAGERRAREQAEARAGALETQIAALEAELIALSQAGEQAEARIGGLEQRHAAERQARELAEAATRRLEAERAAAREALEALRRRLGASDGLARDQTAAAADPPAAVADHRPPAGDRFAAAGPILAAVPAPVRPTPTPEPRHVVRAAPPPAPGVAAPPVPESGAIRPAGPRRSRSATVHRPATPPDAGVATPLTDLLHVGPGPAQSLRGVLPRALAVVGEESDWDAVTMWQRTQRGRPLTCLGVWTRPGSDLAWFESISWRAKLDVGESPSGDLDPLGRLAWVADLGDEGGSVRERTARSARLAARVLVPLSDADGPAGALEVYARRPRPLEEVVVARLTTAAGLLAPRLLFAIAHAEQRRWRI